MSFIMKTKIATALVTVFISTSTLAQGSIEAGKLKAISCAACHGQQGNSLIAMYPNLAGQHAKYIVKQLTEFKLASQTGGEKGRNNAVMNGMSMALSNQDILDLSAYYSSLEQEQGEAPEDVIEHAQAIYRGGDLSRGITACTACHGPQGNGASLANFPDISGQKVDYIKSQLEMFRSGGRVNDANGMMRKVAAKLTDKDIDALSKYLRGLR